MRAKKSTYLKGFSWFVASLFISCSNDAITKLLSKSDGSQALNTWVVTFFRLFFGALWLVACALRKPQVLHTPYRKLHVLRGATFFVASALFTYGISLSPMTTATLISFAIPLFVLVLSPLLLREKVTLRLALYAITGFGGVLLVLAPKGTDLFTTQAVPFIIAAILFASLDVVNKYYAEREKIFPMIFYSTLAALCLATPFAYMHRSPLAIEQLLLLALLGAGGNAIIYALLQAYRYASLVSLAPVRYLELLLSILASLLLFGEKPGYELWGSLLIIPAVLAIIYDQQSGSGKKRPCDNAQRPSIENS